MGDLGNIQADAKGIAHFKLSSKIIEVVGYYSILGRGVVVHLNKDDLGMGMNMASEENGNSGARIGCCVI